MDGKVLGLSVEDVELEEEIRTARQARIGSAILVAVFLFWAYKRGNLTKLLMKPTRPSLHKDYAQLAKRGYLLRQDPKYNPGKMVFLAQGSFSRVYGLVNDGEGQGKIPERVVKVGDTFYQRQEEVQGMFNEAALLSLLKGKAGIIELKKAYAWDTKVYLELEYMDGGNLGTYSLLSRTTRELGSAGRRCTPRQVAAIMKQVLQGLTTLHNLHIVHRDIRPDNIMFNTNGDAKIVDFGASTKPYSSRKLHWKHIGTREFMAPEMLKNQPYTEKADIWSVGASILSLYSTVYDMTSFAFSTTSAIKMMVFGDAQYKGFHFAPIMWSSLPDKGMEDFCRLCMQTDPEKRPSASELLQHPFILNGGNHWDVGALAEETIRKFPNALQAASSRAIADANEPVQNE